MAKTIRRVINIENALSDEVVNFSGLYNNGELIDYLNPEFYTASNGNISPLQTIRMDRMESIVRWAKGTTNYEEAIKLSGYPLDLMKSGLVINKELHAWGDDRHYPLKDLYDDVTQCMDGLLLEIAAYKVKHGEITNGSTQYYWIQ